MQSFRNVGTIDRVIRILAGLALIALGFGAMEGTSGTVLGIVGFVPLATGLAGFCPLYRLVGLSTCPVQRT